MTTEKFQEIILQICSADTSSHPENWNVENPTQGHCAVVSLLAQDLFGGKIVRVSLDGTQYEEFNSHYFNLIDNKEYDFTIEQFEGNPYLNEERTEKDRKEILSNPDTKNRYEKLKERFNNKQQINL